MIYADNAATTKMSEAALRRMVSVIEETWGNPSSLYSAGQRAKEALETARQELLLAPTYDYTVVNDDSKRAAREIKDILELPMEE